MLAVSGWRIQSAKQTFIRLCYNMYSLSVHIGRGYGGHIS